MDDFVDGRLKDLDHPMAILWQVTRRCYLSHHKPRQFLHINWWMKATLYVKQALSASTPATRKMAHIGWKYIRRLTKQQVTQISHDRGFSRTLLWKCRLLTKWNYGHMDLQYFLSQSSHSEYAGRFYTALSCICFWEPWIFVRGSWDHGSVSHNVLQSMPEIKYMENHARALDQQSTLRYC